MIFATFIRYVQNIEKSNAIVNEYLKIKNRGISHDIPDFSSSRLEALTLLEHPVSLREQFLRNSELFIVQFTDLVVFGRNRRWLVVVRVDLVHELLFGPGHLVVVEATVLGRRFMDQVTDTDRGMSLGIGVAERFNHTNLVWIFVNDIVHIYNIENPDEVVNLFIKK